MDLGLQLALSKCQAPSLQMMWIGVWFYAVSMLKSIHPERIHEVVELCKEFIMATNVTLQAAKFGWKIISRVQIYLRCKGIYVTVARFSEKSNGVTNGTVTLDAREDASWFISFLSVFNGVTTMKGQTMW